MSYMSGLTLGGNTWTPQFLQAISWETCLGCNRCLRVCGRGVMVLVALNANGEVTDADDDEIERRVMSIVRPENCIGCQACDHICPKHCHTFAPAPC